MRSVAGSLVADAPSVELRCAGRVRSWHGTTRDPHRPGVRPDRGALLATDPRRLPRRARGAPRRPTSPPEYSRAATGAGIRETRAAPALPSSRAPVVSPPPTCESWEPFRLHRPAMAPARSIRRSRCRACRVGRRSSWRPASQRCPPRRRPRSTAPRAASGAATAAISAAPSTRRSIRSTRRTSTTCASHGAGGPSMNASTSRLSARAKRTGPSRSAACRRRR